MLKRQMLRKAPQKVETSTAGGVSSLMNTSNITAMSETGRLGDQGREKEGALSNEDKLGLTYCRLQQAQSLQYLFEESQSKISRDMEAQSATLARLLLNATEELLELERVEQETSLLQNESCALTHLEDVLTPVVEAAQEIKEAANILGGALQVCKNQLATKGLDFSGDVEAAFTELSSTLAELVNLNMSHEAPYEQVAQALCSIEESTHNIRDTLPKLEKEVNTLNQLALLNGYASADSNK